MNDTTDHTSAIYDAIAAFQRTHRLPGLQHAQIRGLLAEHLARALPAAAAVPVPAADRAADRELIAAALYRHEWPQPGGPWEEALAADREVFLSLADAVLGVLPAPTSQAAVLTKSERTMLAYALDQAQERIWSEDGFTDEDQAAVDRLRWLAGEAAQQPDTETEARLNGPVPDCNSGPGWYEVISPRNATTCIALVYEDGSLYLPEGEDALTADEFAFAAARGDAHKLVRADEVQQDGMQP